MPHKSEPSPSAQTASAVKPQGPRLRVEAPTVVLAHGVVMEGYEGTPQGGSPSPLLANVLLDEADKELERRRHAFERYADDLNIYVRSQRASERVLVSLRKLFGKLNLRINENKSKVTRAMASKFLGFSFCVAKGRTIWRRVASGMKERVRETDPAQCRPQPRADVRAARNLPLGLEGLLPAHGGTGHACRHRRLGPPSVAGRATQALEARSGHLPRVGRPRGRGGLTSPPLCRFGGLPAFTIDAP
jgi:hypothetical protein